MRTTRDETPFFLHTWKGTPLTPKNSAADEAAIRLYRCVGELTKALDDVGLFLIHRHLIDRRQVAERAVMYFWYFAYNLVVAYFAYCLLSLPTLPTLPT